ncbi:uncharacterized protein UTRI_10119 [Ustilago trichophora]|uniref:Uncharacterized protein n=1 Tax=Ustilago trichophora TaxID=86804 RepID=A0A5C3E2D2_9BASI|nr:uncharacterized protein UTRI_10119 [Ustilago trichophora]
MTIDILYYEEPTGVIFHHTAIHTGEVVRIVDFDGHRWISDASDIVDYSDQSKDSYPTTVPVYLLSTGAQHGRVHIDATGDLSYHVGSYAYYQCRNWEINRCCRAPGTAATNYQSRAFGSAEFSNHAYTDLLAIYRSNGGRSCGIAVATRGGTTGTQCLTNRAASKRGANYSNCGNICQGVGGLTNASGFYAGPLSSECKCCVNSIGASCAELCHEQSAGTSGVTYSCVNLFSRKRSTIPITLNGLPEDGEYTNQVSGGVDKWFSVQADPVCSGESVAPEVVVGKTTLRYDGSDAAKAVVELVEEYQGDSSEMKRDLSTQTLHAAVMAIPGVDLLIVSN